MSETASVIGIAIPLFVCVYIAVSSNKEAFQLTFMSAAMVQLPLLTAYILELLEQDSAHQDLINIASEAYGITVWIMYIWFAFLLVYILFFWLNKLGVVQKTGLKLGGKI
jgi:hypothetical protein